jgi:hypothetical protein
LKRSLAPLWLAFLVATNAAPGSAAPFSATLSFHAWNSPPAAMFGVGSGTSAQGALTIGSGALAGTAVAPVTGQPPFGRIRVLVTGQGVGSFSGTPLAGSMPLHGISKGSVALGTFAPLFSVPLFTGHEVGSGAGVAGLGVGGRQTQHVGSYQTVDVQRNLWHAGTAKVTGVGVRERFTFHRGTGVEASRVSYLFRTTRFTGTVTFTGSDSRTPGGLGQITLVSPTRIQVRIGETIHSLVVVAELALNFVPEPSTLVLLGAGSAALAALGGRRLR